MRFAIILFLFFLSKASFSQSDSARYEITLLTCAPGDELYSTFGHSAIRVVDRQRRTDEVYNYGIFDFDTPNFYVKFVRGKLDYKLGKQSFRRFLREYEYYQRDVVENRFLLNDLEAQKFVELLEENYKPENRYYAYDFFFDNCSSRIRDIYESTKGSRLDGQMTKGKEITFRQMLDYYLADKPWSDFGIDLILGQPSDAITDFRDQMFLPDYLKDNLRVANSPAVDAKKIIYAFPLTQVKPRWFTLPIFLTSMLLLVVVLLSFLKNESLATRIFDGIFFMISGLAGCLFLFMWLGTDHQACWSNWNMLWLFPLNLFIGWQLFKEQLTEGARKYFQIVSAWIAIAVVFWWLIPQQYHSAFLPLMLAMLIRLYYRDLTFLKRPTKNNKA